MALDDRAFQMANIAVASSALDDRAFQTIGGSTMNSALSDRAFRITCELKEIITNWWHLQGSGGKENFVVIIFSGFWQKGE